MLKIFSRDRGTDFEFFEFTDSEIKYKTIDYYDINKQEKNFYRSLKPGTIILNGNHIYVETASKEQFEYIESIIDLFENTVSDYEKNYSKVFLNYSSGNSISDIIINKSVMEVPDFRKFKEWTYIKGFGYLKQFVYDYQKYNNLKNKR